MVPKKRGCVVEARLLKKLVAELSLNRIHQVRTVAICLFLVLGSPCLGKVSGTLYMHTIESSVLGDTRVLRVWLPAGYFNNSKARYPVLYLMDGQNLFDAATSTFSDEEWKIDETLTRLIAAGTVAPLIVVGIDHGGKGQRSVEYLPYPDEFLEPPVESPQGAIYPEFLGKEVMPFIDKAYRTLPGPANRILGGSSYGALISLYSASVRTDLSYSLLLESPSLYVDERRVLSDLEMSGTRFEKVYIGIGTNELGTPNCDEVNPGNREAVEDARRVYSLLLEKGIEESDILLLVEKCATHSEAAWSSRFGRAIQFLTTPF